MSKWWFTADEHYGHAAVIAYNRRPFSSAEAMAEALIANHNALVKPQDITVHAGDFCWKAADKNKILRKLHGTHIVLKGSHGPAGTQIWEKTIEGQPLVVCHYAMRVWPRSHYGSWQLYGHSHGRLEGAGKQMDVGVDTHDYKPYLWDEIVAAMVLLPDNFNSRTEQ